MLSPNDCHIHNLYPQGLACCRSTITTVSAHLPHTIYSTASYPPPYFIMCDTRSVVSTTVTRTTVTRTTVTTTTVTTTTVTRTIVVTHANDITYT